MKKSLRVHTYDSSIENEYYYLLRVLRRSVAAIASNMGLKSFRSLGVLNTIASELNSYIGMLAGQTRIICSMKHHMKANFVDVLHALELLDKQLLDTLLSEPVLSNAEVETTDDTAIQRYANIRLNRPNNEVPDITIGFNDRGMPITESALNNFDFVKSGTSYVEMVAGRCASVLRPTQPIPQLVIDELVASPKILLPLSPSQDVWLQDIIKEHKHRKEVDGLNQPLYTMYLQQAAQPSSAESFTMKLHQTDTTMGAVGKILKPYRYQDDQPTTVRALNEQFYSLMSDSDPHLLNIENLPINIPSQVDWWMPVYPLGPENLDKLVDSVPDKPESPGGGRVQDNKSGGADQTAAPTQGAPENRPLGFDAALEEKVELQIELCNVEPDFPSIVQLERSTKPA
ncbi:hypothetical protein GNI_164460 [Gregarina niphandrodes]|uniref:Bromodomain associated domain-containing protein n=1 Tax=Gregarina niphandrodes TaxID=110365 RepID=A0A023AYU1_GRENI|nr:hypothetical protein GNI_164460 [Gregarina niphandrodes]EZG43623.1 hypothetical protein GNI_164460 [Gregarina niphandrodes]|eukprot:XP_011133151.1 hypothetical protein GNI_164460 [Gregarina niphandrodes]